MRTVEATIDKSGTVHLLDSIELPQTYRTLVIILEDEPRPRGLRPYGLAKDQFTVPDDFDAPLALVPADPS